LDRFDHHLLTVRSAADVAVFSLVINVLLLVSPLYMLQVYDRVLPAANTSTLIYLTIAGVLALGFLGLLEVVRSIYSQRAAAALDRRLGTAAFMASLSGARADSGDIQPLRDLGMVRSFIASKGLANLFDLPFAPLFIVLLYFIHPVLCWLTVAGTVLMILIVVANQLSAAKPSARANEQYATSNLVAQAFVRNGDTLRSMGIGRNAVDVWGKSFARAIGDQDRASTVNAIFGSLSRSMRMLLQLGILGVGAWLVLRGEMTAGMIFAASIISGRALQPIDQLIGGWRQVGDARKAWQRLKASLTSSRQSTTQKITLPEPKGAIAVQNLTFLRPGATSSSEPILRQISFKIRPGETIALIGPSRAGKSTLARLLVGAAQPSGGAVLVDNADLRTWDEVQIGRTIGYLAQDVQLLPGTVAENVSRFDPEASDEAIVAAAQQAQAHELILSLPEGYQTRIGYSGAVLSGGERQRIGLARAFYGNPKMLVLDEPNANLDSDGEAALERALKTAHGNGSTVILITHRMSIAAACDRVLILKNGSVAAFGPPAEVLQRSNGVTPNGHPIKAPAGPKCIGAFSTSANWGGRGKPMASDNG
jgi:PrtD family type I secretion system ABC transporter